MISPGIQGRMTLLAIEREIGFYITMHAIVFMMLLTAADPSVIRTRIKGSLTQSLERSDPLNGQMLAMQVERLVRWKGDPCRKIHAGDSISVVYTRDAMPELLAVEYKGLEVTFDAYRHQDSDGMMRFFDGTGYRYEAVLNNSPTVYAQVTEWMQCKQRGQRGHKGIDLKSDTGTPVVAPFAGTVTRVNWSRRVNGLCIEMVHPGGKITRFLHLSEVAKGIHRGAHVAKGQHIGRVGSTGRSSAPHLHYEIEGSHGRPIDPIKLHGTSPPTQLTGTQLTAFQQVLANYNRLIDGVACKGSPCVAASRR